MFRKQLNVLYRELEDDNYRDQFCINFLYLAAIVTSADQAPFIALSMFIKNVEIMRTYTCVSPLELENKALKERIKVLEAEIVQLNARLALLYCARA